jgi:hypothetical protein
MEEAVAGAVAVDLWLERWSGEEALAVFADDKPRLPLGWRRTLTCQIISPSSSSFPGQ